MEYLKTGATPDFDFAGSMMAEVIEHNTGKLTEADLKAIAMYLEIAAASPQCILMPMQFRSEKIGAIHAGFYLMFDTGRTGNALMAG